MALAQKMDWPRCTHEKSLRLPVLYQGEKKFAQIQYQQKSKVAAALHFDPDIAQNYENCNYVL